MSSIIDADVFFPHERTPSHCNADDLLVLS